MTDVPLSLNVLNGGKDTYFPSDRLSGQMKAKGKTHVCFPKRPLFQHWNGSTGRFSYTDFRLIYIRLQMCAIMCAFNYFERCRYSSETE